jgi:peptide deformylase
VSSILARRANIGFSMVNVDLDATISDVEHVAGIYNKVYDGLSRGLTGRQVGLPEELEVILTPQSMATKYIALCNPRLTPLETPEEHLVFSQALLALLTPVHAN